MTGIRKMLNYLPENHTESGYIAAKERLHDALSFVYRPLLVAERDALDEARRFRPAREASNLVATAVAKAIVEWDLRDEHGCPVAVGLGSVRRLRPALFERLYAVVSGWQPSDSSPDVNEAKLIEAAGVGCTPCEEQQETD